MYYRGYVDLKQNCRSGFSKYDIEDSEKRFEDLQNCSIASYNSFIALYFLAISITMVVIKNLLNDEMEFFLGLKENKEECLDL